MNEMLTGYKEIREEEQERAENTFGQKLSATVHTSERSQDHSTDDEHIRDDLEREKEENNTSVSGERR